MCALNGCYWIHHKVKEWLWCGVENKGGGAEEEDGEEEDGEEEEAEEEEAGNGRRTRRSVMRGELAERWRCVMRGEQAAVCIQN
jgi:TATA-binding protein-associated factor Taf7